MKILIVEDEVNAREALKTYLGKQGFDIEVAGNSKQAVTKGMYMKPDLLITDWMLEPDGDGVEIAKILKLVHPDMKIIFITGYKTDELMPQCQQIGGTILTKPLSLTDLKKLINKQLQ